MSEFRTSFPIESLRYETAGSKYEVIIYQRAARFYAGWYCRSCRTRRETGTFDTAESAKRAAQDEIGVHHSDHHRTFGDR